MTFDEMQKRALEIRKKYDDLNLVRDGKVWTENDYAMGFVGDVGDLMKLMTAKNGVRPAENVDSKIGHELSDCLWSLFVFADIYKIDLRSEFERTMKYLDKSIAKKMETK